MAGNLKRGVLNFQDNPPKLRDTIAGNTVSHGQVLAWDTNTGAFHLTPQQGGGGGGGAPTDASYVTLSASANLSAERVLTAGAGIAIQDGGAGAALTISSTGGGGGGAPTGASYVTLAQDQGLSAERVLTAGTQITIQDGGAGAALTISTTSAPQDARYLMFSDAPANATLVSKRVLTVGAGLTATFDSTTMTLAQDGNGVANPLILSGSSQLVSVAAATLVLASAHLDVSNYVGTATRFQAILAAASTTYTTRVRLYDVAAATHVASSDLTTANTSPTTLAALVTLAAGARTLEVHGDLLGTASTTATGIVGMLAIKVE